jgi:hypothetical protein
MNNTVGRYTYGAENIKLYTYGSEQYSMTIGSFTSIAKEIRVFLADGRGHEYVTGTTKTKSGNIQQN